MKKKMSMRCADGAKNLKPAYADGASSIKAKATDKLLASAPRFGSADPLSPNFTGPPERGNSDAGLDEAAAEDRTAIKSQTYADVTPDEAPAARKMGVAAKAPADYKEAAAVLRSDKALMAQYHAGVASGKAFSMSIGGKTFKYAATASPGASKTPSAKPATAKTSGKQAADQGYAQPDPQNPATAENASPSLRKMGMPGLEDYASGPKDTRPGINGGRVQNTPSETDAAWRKYAGTTEMDDAKATKVTRQDTASGLRKMGMPGLDSYETSPSIGRAGGDIRKDVESRTNRMSKEQGLLQSYTNMSPKERASRAGVMTYENYDYEATKAGNTNLAKDLPRAKAKKMKASSKKG